MTRREFLTLAAAAGLPAPVLAASTGTLLYVAASRVVSCRARNFAIRSIRRTGTGSDNGNLSVPLLRSYRASSLANASTNASLAG